MEPLNITLYLDPSYQKRHRLGRGRMYDPMSKFKQEMRARLWDFKARIEIDAFFMHIFAVRMVAYYPIPKSLSKRKKKALEGNLKDTKPDFDNIEKLWADICTGVFFEDDKLIAQSSFEKRHSAIPRIEINFYPVEDRLIQEHAITYKDHISPEDLAYIVKKANRLGVDNRRVTSVYTMEDEEGKHIYFSVENIYHGGDRS